MWGTASDSHMDGLDTLHAKVAKIIYNIKENCSDEEVLQKANWESISYFYKRRLLTWMHQIYYETCPLPITEHFTKKSGRLTNPLQFVVPWYCRDIGRTSLKYGVAVLWDTVDTNLKKYSNLNTFKNKIKQLKSSINKLSFRKMSCMITKKSHDYYYF